MGPSGKINDLRLRADAALWTQGAPYLRVLRLAVAVGRDMREGNLTLRATGLVYTTLLSLAPLLALSFSVLKGFGVHNMLEPFLQSLLKPLGAQSRDVAARIIEFVSNMQVGVLGAVGLAALLYSVVTLMGEIEDAFNDIWRVRRARPLALKVRDYLSVLLIGPVLMFISVALTTVVRFDALADSWAAVLFGQGIAWLLFVAVFTALYMFMPYTRVRAGPALVAGALTAVLWKTLGWLFGVFIAGSASYAAIYSAFAALVLFIIWLYVGWLVVLIGASLCYYLQNPTNQRLSRRARSLSVHAREKIALQVCAETGAAFYAGKAPPDSLDLAARLSLPALAIEDVADDLVAAGILARANDGLIPGSPFDVTTAGDMLARLRGADGPGATFFTATPGVDAVLASVDAARRAAGSTTLKQLATGQP